MNCLSQPHARDEGALDGSAWMGAEQRNRNMRSSHRSSAVRLSRRLARLQVLDDRRDSKGQYLLSVKFQAKRNFEEGKPRDKTRMVCKPTVNASYTQRTPTSHSAVSCRAFLTSSGCAITMSDGGVIGTRHPRRDDSSAGLMRRNLRCGDR